MNLTIVEKAFINYIKGQSHLANGIYSGSFDISSLMMFDNLEKKQAITFDNFGIGTDCRKQVIYYSVKIAKGL